MPLPIKKASMHKNALADVQSRELKVRHPRQDKGVITIAELRRKKIKTILQEDRQWLKVDVVQTDLTRVHAYIGCSKYGNGNDVPPGLAFTCENRSKPDCITSPKYLLTVKSQMELEHYLSQHSMRTPNSSSG